MEECVISHHEQHSLALHLTKFLQDTLQSCPRLTLTHRHTHTDATAENKTQKHQLVKIMKSVETMETERLISKMRLCTVMASYAGAVSISTI